MHNYLRRFSPVAVVAALAFVSLFVSLSTAQEEQLRLPPPHQNEAAEPIPAPPVTGEMVQPAPPITYRASRSARRMYRGSDAIEVVMVTRNPADCCLYEIPLCLPACCVGEPRVDERRGILGRGVVEYCWDCGFTATVKFRHRIGDVKVEYDGD